PISGDWRSVNGSSDLHLLAALSVPVPGFPVPRPEAFVASGAVQSLVAAGAVPLTKEKTVNPDSTAARLVRRRRAREIQLRVERAEKRRKVLSLAAKTRAFAYNPDQWRVPKGNGKYSGRWIDMPSLDRLNALLQSMMDGPGS